MEVRDPIHGAIVVSPDELKVVDSPIFQRLRNIKQTGFSDMAFPGATHSRYIHSIGTLELAGRAFDSIFRDHRFKRRGLGVTFRRLVRLAALLHDAGHAPLSHCTEFAMPDVDALAIPCYDSLEKGRKRRATHEDYTIKIITDSSLSALLQERFKDFSPLHVAALVNQDIPLLDDFFLDNGINYRPVLSQIISSELDADRMDYLRRDSYFAGVSYGTYDCDWIFSNLTYHVTESNAAHLALDPRAIYAFNDFLLSRYHMFLMVYFHHKSVIYEEMFKKYFESGDAEYIIPADIEAYVDVDDYQLHQFLRREAQAGKEWAARITSRNALRLLHEIHGQPDEIDLTPQLQALDQAGIAYISACSRGDLSRYSQVGQKRRKGMAIYVVDRGRDSRVRTTRVKLLEEVTDLFARYQAQRQLSRIYVAREELDRSRKLLTPLMP